MCMCVCLCMLGMCEGRNDRQMNVFIDLCSTRLSAQRAPALQETSSVTDPYHPEAPLRSQHTHSVSQPDPITLYQTPTTEKT